MLATTYWASPLSAQITDKAIIAHTSESISLAPLLYGIDKGYYPKKASIWSFASCAPILPAPPWSAAGKLAKDLVDFRILREAVKDIDGKS
jgi:hypothetical protein